jgi:hypothetical protein
MHSIAAATVTDPRPTLSTEPVPECYAIPAPTRRELTCLPHVLPVQWAYYPTTTATIPLDPTKTPGKGVTGNAKA